MNAPLLVNLPWSQVALRLALTVGCALAVGYNRSEHGKVAGMVTMLLVALAASIAMLQVNVLLPTDGRGPSSFVMNDLMRLPLGILTGVGFIGGGVILRRGDAVVGVTTAATLWLITVVGLCLGGGQIALGLAGTALALFALWLVKHAESRLRREFRARLWIEIDAQGPSEPDLRHRLQTSGLSIVGSRCTLESAAVERRYVYELLQTRLEEQTETPALVRALAGEPGVLKVRWEGL